jgi:ribose transport system permease protein
MRPFLKRLVADYGMAGVLVLLCAYYSWATFTTHEPRGEAAGRILAAQVARSAPNGGNILIVARGTEEDARLAERLEARLKAERLNVIGKVLGDPRAARQALQKYDADRTPLAAIATTPECAVWTVFEGMAEKYPNLGRPRLVIPQSYRWPTFLKKENLLNVANQIVVVAILAIGMTLVIITGGIDLSVGSLIAFSAVVTTSLIRGHGGAEATTGTLLLAAAAGIGACALIGLFSGTVVTVFRIPPFIGTLAVMQVASGLAFIVARGGSIYELPDSLTWLGRGVGWFGIPHAVVLMAVLYVIAHVIMSRTVLGRYIYAVGGNVEATRLSGVRVNAIVVLVYVVSGALAGLGGVLLASQLKSGAPTYGLSYELYVIAAVVVGGTSLSGGAGRIFGTLIGALIMAVIQNGMNLTGVESYTQKVVLGVVILGAVLLDMLKRRNWRELFSSLRPMPRGKAAPVFNSDAKAVSSNESD